MENSEDIQENGIKQPLLSNPSKGGFRTLPFIVANEGFENAASSGLSANMITYLMGEYGMTMAKGSNIILLWRAATDFTPILGAFLADSFVGRFLMIGVGSIVSLLGMLLLWSTTMIPGARPDCGEIAANSCISPTAWQFVFLCFTLGLMSIGAGGIRSSSLAFGADQLTKSNKHEHIIESNDTGGVLESLFSWYFIVVFSSAIFAQTIIVYIQDHMGWKVGFGVPVLLMFLSAITFFSASSFYIKLESKDGLFTRIAQVLVASWRKRHYTISAKDRLFHATEASTLDMPSEKLRFLNKACTVEHPKQDSTSDGRSVDPWRTCTVDQVEELKSLIRILPVWSTGLLYNVNITQSSSRVILANSMDRHILNSNFEIPAASFDIVIILTTVLWLALYDRVIIPLASKAAGKPVHLDALTRMGIGFTLSLVSMVVAAMVESIRRNMAGGRLTNDSTLTTESMSALWLVPPILLLGLAGAFITVAQNEFFYSELPASMSCVALNLFRLGSASANLIASLLVSVIDHVTRIGEEPSWVASNPDEGHYDYYYWVLAGLSFLNYAYFLYCSRSYRPARRV